MTWTTPKDWVVDELVTATMMNAHVRDNLLHLFNRPMGFVYRNQATSYTTVSTSFVDIDATNLKITLTPSSQRVLCVAAMRLGMAAGGIGSVTWTDGSQVLGDATYGLASVGASVVENLVALGVFSNLTPGTQYDFKPQYKTSSGAATCTVYQVAYPLTIFALEI